MDEADARWTTAAHGSCIGSRSTECLSNSMQSAAMPRAIAPALRRRALPPSTVAMRRTARASGRRNPRGGAAVLEHRGGGPPQVVHLAEHVRRVDHYVVGAERDAASGGEHARNVGQAGAEGRVRAGADNDCRAGARGGQHVGVRRVHHVDEHVRAEQQGALGLGAPRAPPRGGRARRRLGRVDRPQARAPHGAGVRPQRVVRVLVRAAEANAVAGGQQAVDLGRAIRPSGGPLPPPPLGRASSAAAAPAPPAPRRRTPRRGRV